MKQMTHSSMFAIGDAPHCRHAIALITIGRRVGTMWPKRHAWRKIKGTSEGSCPWNTYSSVRELRLADPWNNLQRTSSDWLSEGNTPYLQPRQHLLRLLRPERTFGTLSACSPPGGLCPGGRLRQPGTPPLTTLRTAASAPVVVPAFPSTPVASPPLICPMPATSWNIPRPPTNRSPSIGIYLTKALLRLTDVLRTCAIFDARKRSAGEGIERGSSKGRPEGKYRSSVASLVSLRTRPKVKNTRSVFKVCRTVHEGHKRPKRGVTIVANTLAGRVRRNVPEVSSKMGSANT
eukprot:1188625-Prorocentrum_minimum.AAC.3